MFISWTLLSCVLKPTLYLSQSCLLGVYDRTRTHPCTYGMTILCNTSHALTIAPKISFGLQVVNQDFNFKSTSQHVVFSQCFRKCFRNLISGTSFPKNFYIIMGLSMFCLGRLYSPLGSFCAVISRTLKACLHRRFLPIPPGIWRAFGKSPVPRVWHLHPHVVPGVGNLQINIFFGFSTYQYKT